MCVLGSSMHAHVSDVEKCSFDTDILWRREGSAPFMSPASIFPFVSDSHMQVLVANLGGEIEMLGNNDGLQVDGMSFYAEALSQNAYDWTQDGHSTFLDQYFAVDL